MTFDLTTATPVAIDTELAEIWGETQKFGGWLDRVRNEIKRGEAGDRFYAHNLDDARKRATELEGKVAALRAAAAPYEDEFDRRGGWLRYFLVTNGNGHVHRGMNCTTCYPTTCYAWLIDLADCDEAAMIEEWGERACTVCFPDAPTNPNYNRAARIDRDAREIRAREKAERDAKKAAKTLEPELCFKDTVSWEKGDRVETVARAKEALRNCVEARVVLGAPFTAHNPSYYEGKAARADKVEADATWALRAKGVTDEEIAKIKANTEKRVRKDYNL